jgi:hypothetical protein
MHGLARQEDNENRLCDEEANHHAPARAIKAAGGHETQQKGNDREHDRHHPPVELVSAQAIVRITIARGVRALALAMRSILVTIAFRLPLDTAGR